MCQDAYSSVRGPGWCRSDVEKMTETSPAVEDLIFKIEDRWVCVLLGLDGRPVKTRVDYNPWTGEKLS